MEKLNTSANAFEAIKALVAKSITPAAQKKFRRLLRIDNFLYQNITSVLLKIEQNQLISIWRHGHCGGIGLQGA